VREWGRGGGGREEGVGAEDEGLKVWEVGEG